MTTRVWDTYTEKQYDHTQMVKRSKITYRQLDHWTSKGYLVPVNPTPGTGTARTWSQQEIGVAILMSAMVRGGGMKPELASQFARALVQGPGPVDDREVEMFPGLHVVVRDVSALLQGLEEVDE